MSDKTPEEKPETGQKPETGKTIDDKPDAAESAPKAGVEREDAPARHGERSGHGIPFSGRRRGARSARSAPR